MAAFNRILIQEVKNQLLFCLLNSWFKVNNEVPTWNLGSWTASSKDLEKVFSPTCIRTAVKW